ncbi:MAG: hypothetical protein IKJ43_04495 [Bacilli bacterium]|nr:hypothetical protein [Bacilli bacterium]
MEDIKLIEDVKASMPESIAAIGYGSGVFRQKGYAENEVPDKDIILVVDDFGNFLSEDFEMHPEHFSDDFDKRVLNKKRKRYYDNLGCLKFYKDNIHYKVMVISKKALEHDLTTWSHFGMAGRLTKPILYNTASLPGELDSLIHQNRTNALITALLFNTSDKIDRKDLYRTISKMTYMYDFRTILPGEKKTKSDDIVEGAIDWFDSYYLYNEILSENPIMDIDGNTFINKHPIELIDRLPNSLSNYIKRKLKVSSSEELSKKDIDIISKIINNYLFRTNLINSIRLAIASSSTLGPKETIKHGLQKFQKHLKK